MDVTEALLDSWDRQSRIIKAVASQINELNRRLKPSEDGMALDNQLAHIHKVRLEWLSQFAPEKAAHLGDSYQDGWTTPIADLDQIKNLLEDSSAAVRDAVSESIKSGGAASGGYDNPVMFLQHMVWHEGWHVGLIFLALRLGGQEPAEIWEEKNVWSEWRIEG